MLTGNLNVWTNKISTPFSQKIRVFVVTKYIKYIESLTNPQCIWLEAIKVHSSILKTHDGLRFENVFSILVFFA